MRVTVNLHFSWGVLYKINEKVFMKWSMKDMKIYKTIIRLIKRYMCTISLSEDSNCWFGEDKVSGIVLGVIKDGAHN